ncbi:MAG: hypothetical protein A2511_13530 [Deltaproteobacteria bacterium RIFOXYD12_FULL_50_9]|nr:MAG: hypothetical protein A2511_13530 [Deltaproteobacteria bacterium RIFOXYD12_FULL_50_9]
MKAVEGRYPNVFISSKIAAAIGDQAKHVKFGGFENQYYRDMIVKLVSEHGPVSREVIDEVLMNKLPEIITEKQKKTKIHNLLYELSTKSDCIHNIGSRRLPKWILGKAEGAIKSNKKQKSSIGNRTKSIYISTRYFFSFLCFF